VASEKKRAPWVPALIVPPDPLALLEEWKSYRAGLDVLEARLLVSHPDLHWLDGLRAFKAQADAVIRLAPKAPTSKSIPLTDLELPVPRRPARTASTRRRPAA
jgi:hypothetical protein